MPEEQLSDQAVAIAPAPSEPATTIAVADLTKSIAGSQPWVVRCPYAVEITWNGGSPPEDIAIRIETPATDATPFVRSYLGAGLVSFYPGYQFQTEAPHNLWVRGPINRPKDGIAAVDSAAMQQVFQHLGTTTVKGSPVLGIVFSRNRAMQLDATLRSFFLHCADADEIPCACPR